jgi:8-hydroxy-5-deazaflavin:NADPH oxidoreductase
MRLGSKLVSVGHEEDGVADRRERQGRGVDEGNEPKASAGTFDDAAKFGEVVFNCTAGPVSLEALKQAVGKNLGGKVLVDVANPLDFSKGMPPTLTVCNADSLGEQIQRAFPEARVVKALNTVGNEVMVNPGLVPGEHDPFVCGNDPPAKVMVVEILHAFGWDDLIDLGDITAARGLGMALPLWVRLRVTLKTRSLNFKIAR